MTEMDTDGSGMISINEFESWWSKHGGDLERYRELALTVLAGESIGEIQTAVFWRCFACAEKLSWMDGVQAR